MSSSNFIEVKILPVGFWQRENVIEVLAPKVFGFRQCVTLIEKLILFKEPFLTNVENAKLPRKSIGLVHLLPYVASGSTRQIYTVLY